MLTPLPNVLSILFSLEQRAQGELFIKYNTMTKILTPLATVITLTLIASILFLEIPEGVKSILAAITVISAVTALLSYEMHKANK
jgi:hypothetical protein